MRRSCIRLIPMAALVILAQDGAAYLPAPYGQRLSAPLPDQPVTLDPVQATRESELQLCELLFDPLYRLSGAGRPLPHLVAPEHEVSPNGKLWKLRLRPGILLHSGQILTAAHVATSLDRLRRGGPNAHLLAPVRSISADGAMKIVIRLWRRTPRLKRLLAAPAAGVAVRHRGAWIGTGPFRRRSTADMLRLVANPHHFAGRPFLSELRFKVFKKSISAVQAFELGRSQFSFHGTRVFGKRGRPSTGVDTPVVTTIFLGVGRQRTYLIDPLFRRALLRGIDRQRLGKLAGSGTSVVARNPVSRRLLRSRRRPQVAFDRRAANALLERIATRNDDLRRDASSGRLRLSLLVDASRIEDRKMAGQLVADLDRIGISVTIDAQGASLFEARLASGKYDLVLRRVVVQIPTGSASMAGVMAAGGERSAAAACMRKVRCGARQAARFLRRLPMIPLVHTSTRIEHDVRLGGVHVSRSGRLDFANLFWLRGAP